METTCILLVVVGIAGTIAWRVLGSVAEEKVNASDAAAAAQRADIDARKARCAFAWAEGVKILLRASVNRILMAESKCLHSDPAVFAHPAFVELADALDKFAIAAASDPVLEADALRRFVEIRKGASGLAAMAAPDGQQFFIAFYAALSESASRSTVLQSAFVRAGLPVRELVAMNQDQPSLD